MFIVERPTRSKRIIQDIERYVLGLEREISVTQIAHKKLKRLIRSPSFEDNFYANLYGEDCYGVL